MKKYSLSVLIPARSEEWLARTVQDILEHKEGNTEVIVGLDGQWAEPGIADHEDVTIVYYSSSIGQRQMTNQLCKLSNAKYIMKVDAHCAFDQGFDVKMMNKMQDNWTMVPIMRNLHAFDWVCEDGHRRYQGPSGPCKECGKETHKEVMWIAKKSPQSKSYSFDAEPHFQYFGDWCKRDHFKKDLEETDLTETMSLQGSCFMLTRDKYWELNISDNDTFGSWGSQGIEVACKTWLSGGRVVVNHKTWYAHMFRTQGGDFGFPYPQSGRQVQHAKKYAKKIFFEERWHKAIRPVSWLVERFWPVTYWKDEDLKALKEMEKKAWPTKGIIYYTDNQLSLKIAHAVQKRLRDISAKKDIPIVSASLKPMPKMGKNIHLPLKRGVETYFKQIITALENSTADVVYFCEHDVLYDPSHFDFIPLVKDKFYYNTNVWRWKYPEDLLVTWEANQVAELCCYREKALKWYKDKLKEIENGEFNRRYEPGGRDKNLYENWQSEFPNIDIRHGKNLTKSKWSERDFRDKTPFYSSWKETTLDKIPNNDSLKRMV